MTEKISRRGVFTPHSYESDILQKTTVGQVISNNSLAICDTMKINEVRSWLNNEPDLKSNFIIISDKDGNYKGLVSSSSLYGAHQNPEKEIGSIVKRNNLFISPSQTLRDAVEIMAKENVDLLPVVNEETISGILTYQHIISIYKNGLDDNEKKQAHISLSRQRLKILVHQQKLITLLKGKNKKN